MKKIIQTCLLSLAFIGNSFAAEVELDRVAVIVNSGVVLESEIQDLLITIKAQARSKMFFMRIGK